MIAKYKTPGRAGHFPRVHHCTTDAAKSTLRQSRSEIESLFADAMRKTGVTTEAKIIADGDLHRVRIEGDKPLGRSGWYTLRADCIPAGAFGNWKTGVCATWRADIGRELSSDEQRQHLEHMAKIKRQREEETQARHKAASEKAVKLWRESRQADADHPYLLAKDVHAYSIHQLGGKLLVPLRDTNGTLHGLQFIAADGEKLFGTGTAKASHYHAIGAAPDDFLAVCEGYATGATIHGATGWPVAVAFDAGNLKPVALALREKYPDVLQLICADNDRGTVGNPGLAKGREAAAAVGGTVIAPAFSANSSGTDWNDHAREYGPAATRLQLLEILKEVRHDD